MSNNLSRLIAGFEDSWDSTDWSSCTGTLLADVCAEAFDQANTYVASHNILVTAEKKDEGILVCVDASRRILPVYEKITQATDAWKSMMHKLGLYGFQVNVAVAPGWSKETKNKFQLLLKKV